ERDAEQRRAPHLVPHDLQEIVDVDALLDVVREMEVGVVEQIAVGRRARLRRGWRAIRRQGSHEPERQRAGGHEHAEARTGLSAHAFASCDTHQKFISQFTWNTLPVAPTGIGYAVYPTGEWSMWMTSAFTRKPRCFTG